MSDRAKQRITQALMADSRYGKTMTKENKNKPKPKRKLRPRGNPLKGKYGFKYTVDF